MFFTFTFKPKRVIISVLLIIFFTLLLINYRYISIPSYTSDMEFIVVVDAGHGSIDTGTSYGDILEKDINLEIAKYLFTELKKVNIITVMTRTEDKLYENSRYKDLRQRPIIANNSKADLFISIHANNYPSSQPSGSQIFYKINSDKSKELAESIQNELVKLRNKNNRTLKQGDYYVLNAIKCPGVLIEVGFLSNPEDRIMLTDPEYQKELAVAITKGVINYFQENFSSRTADPDLEEKSQSVNKIISNSDPNRLYYINNKGENLTLIKNKMTFPVANFFNEDYSLQNFKEIMAISALEQLMSPPEGLISPLPKGSSINSLKIKDNIARLDLSSEAKENFIGGAEVELYTVKAISSTLLSINGIDGLEILIDGKEGQSLGGHIIFDRVFTLEL